MPSNGLDSRPLKALIASIFISIFILSFPHIMTDEFETQDQPPRPHQQSGSSTRGSSNPAAGEAEPSEEIGQQMRTPSLSHQALVLRLRVQGQATVKI